MNKPHFFLTTLAVCLALAACKKEGPMGPAGPAGADGNDNIEIYRADLTSDVSLEIQEAPIDWSPNMGVMEVAIPGGLDSGDVVIAISQVRVDDLDAPLNTAISVISTNYLAPHTNDIPGGGNGVDMSHSAGSGQSWDAQNTGSMFLNRNSTYTWAGAHTDDAIVTVYVAPWDNTATGSVDFNVGELTVIVQRYEP